MKNALKAAAIAVALLLALGGCATPSERPGQAPPTPALAASATPAPAATPTPATPDLGIPRSTNWVDLLQDHPVHADLIKAGLNTDWIAAQAEIRTWDGMVPNATVTVAFGSTSGGELLSTGGCKASSGECPSEGLVTGLLPIRQQQDGEPYRDYSKGVLVGFTADNQPFVIYELTLEKR